MMLTSENKRANDKNSHVVNPERSGHQVNLPVHFENQVPDDYMSLGNQARQRFVQSCPIRRPVPSSCPFGGICHSCTRPIQAKLKVSQPDDWYEREADRVTDQIMTALNPQVQTVEQQQMISKSSFGLLLAPSCGEPSTHINCATSGLNTDASYQSERQADEIGEMIAGHLSPSVAVGTGPLPDDIRAVAEKYLGVSLQDVYLQAGHEGQVKAQRENAIAMAEGRTISFGAGQLTTATHRGRALIGHELMHIAQQAAASSFVIQRQTMDSKEADVKEGMTLAPPPEHEQRKAEIAVMKEELVWWRAKRDNLLVSLEAIPKVTSAETVAERKELRDELRSVEEYMIECLTAQIGRIDRALDALWAVMPKACAPGTPDIPEPLWEDLRNLENDKKALEGELKALRRSHTRDEIRIIEEQLAELSMGSYLDNAEKACLRDRLEKRKKELSEFLSGTAEKRAAPGTIGTSTDGRGYVVYEHSVKVGGSLPWRNNNPGNIQRSAYGGDFPGVLGVDQFQHFIFSNVDLGQKAVFLDLQKRRGGPKATLASALRSYVVGLKKEEDLPENKEECKSRGIPPAICVTKEAARTYASKVTGTANLPLTKRLGELSPDEQSALVNAIMFWEGGIGAKNGNARAREYTCDGNAPKEYRDLLGCDE